MRLTLFVILITLSQVLAVSTYSQTVRLNMNLKNTSIRNVLNQIEEQSEYFFIYDATKVEVEKVVSIESNDMTVSEILDELFKGSDIIYKINNRQIVISTSRSDETQQQKKDVSGSVTDAESQPLPGVSIVIKGTTTGTITDFDGNFSLANVPGDATLIFSFVGMKTQEILVAGQTTLNITMEEDAIGIDEVVAIGYGTTTKQNLTTAVSQVKTEDIPKSANSSVNQLLFGRASGLNVRQRSAEPGGAIDLSIRGRGNPLVIIDGIVVPANGLEPGSGIGELNGVRRGGLSDINPADIESVEVLKDASAAIYGVAAADGVILITTKKGKAGRMNISYDGNRSLVKNYDYLQPLNAQEYMETYNRFSEDWHLFNNKMAPFGENPVTGFTPRYSQSDIAAAGQGTDWLSHILRDGSIDNHNININGGTDRVTYYISGNYFNQVGTMENSGAERFKTNMNLNIKLADFLKLNTNFNYTRGEYLNSTAGWQTGGSGNQGFGALQAAVSYPSFLPVKDENGEYTQFSNTGNPVTLLDIADATNTSTVRANVSLDIDLIKDMLAAKLLYGNNYETAKRSLYIPSYVNFENTLRSRGTLANQERQNQTMEATLSFRKEILKEVKLDAVAGMGQYINDGEGMNMRGLDMLDAIGTDNMGAAPVRDAMGSYRYFEKRRSYFVRTNFDILDRYLVSLVYRLDGIDKFFPDNKYDGFPSVSLGWKMHNESFLKEIDKLNLLKLRASIGVTGRPIGTTAYGKYSVGRKAHFDNANTIYVTYFEASVDQPELKWEKTVNSNIGLDFAFFGNRLSGSLDYFSDKVTNLLTQRPTEQLSYIPSFYENDGKRIRDGWEVSLKSVNVATPLFQWDMVLNLSNFNYRWDKRFKNQDLQPYVGEKDDVNTIYVYETDGILQVNEQVSEWQPEQGRYPGSPKFVDQNGDKVLDSNDVVKYSGDPDLIVGLGNNFKYRNFDLSMFFYGQFGAYGFNSTRSWASGRNVSSGSMGATKDIDKTWSISNPEGVWPGISYDEGGLGLNADSDVRLEKRDFVRCRNITLGYTFDKSVVQRFASNLRVYLDVQNPFIFTNYSIGDPELQAGNPKGAPAPFPMARTYSLGVNINF